jgi:hypothetical protein
MQVARKKNIRAILSLLKSKNYKIFDKPYELNLVGVRHDSNVPNKFDDLLYVFWKNEKGNWEGKFYTITTDPGTYWLNNPMSPQGTAILKEGQYINSHKIGLHQGKYKALTQQKPVTVIRDYDRNAVLDFANGKEETGIFGINIHRANATGKTKSIDKYSAGCQVFEDASDFANFLELADKHEKLYGNNFTYTLVDERAYLRKLKRKGLYVALAIGIGIGSFFIYRWYKGKKLIPKI